MSNITNGLPAILGDRLVEGWAKGWPLISGADKAAVLRAMDAGDLGLAHSTVHVPGAPERVNHNALAEQAFAETFGFPIVLCNNGSDAIAHLLNVHGLDEGTIVGPSGTWGMGSWGAVLQAGLTPVLVDSDLATWGVDADAMLAAIDVRTRALLVPPMYGGVPDLERIRTIADQRGLLVLIDAAHAQVARYRGRPLVEWSDGLATSFQSSKGPITTGEGGGVAAPDPTVHATLRKSVHTGMEVPGAAVTMGRNSRMPRLYAALMHRMLADVPAQMRVREELWPKLDAVMRRWGFVPQVHEVDGPQYKHASRRGEHDLFEGVSTPTLRAALTHLTRIPFESPYPGCWNDPTWHPEMVKRSRVRDDVRYRAALDATKQPFDNWAEIARNGVVVPHEALLNEGAPDTVDRAFEVIRANLDRLRQHDRSQA